MVHLLNISIIIPLLNEADNISQLIAHINSHHPPPLQVIMVDGGSTDDSVGIARRLLNDLSSVAQTAIDWHVIESIAGRARQMNAGAMLATGDVLLFLHADTQLPIDAIDNIQQAMIQYDWGRFDVRLNSRDPLLKIVGLMINQRSRLVSIATGDQAIFIKKSVFGQLGGYADQPLMEDVELCKRLKRIARPACLKSKVTTSARRWQQHGTWRTIFLMWYLRFDYWRGVSPEVLRQRYYR
ncbi:TIGR04283 family arsenosugar biosynthesis glycosyltransferase [Psychrobacter sp. NG254]|uniref:TIGR04283 family arsenosugar biosynthesis glycosyltransferase n=1 Tax=unclassified Psychrobacter TaxID=196806 RepID=UPI0018886FB4|nr:MULTISPECIES: TIGR04283 family arsenosugar biosynthesis glycosyltransferase [unclassified Psychrobacter]MBF2719511.1 TIGR04283 family arsenosugar biosynthesis glycosyltransferase [Psychrobacter sp. NG254]